MVFLYQACAAIVLVMLTLVMHSAGTAALIHWIRDHLARGIYRLGSVSSAVLMVRFVSLIICLHTLEILLWAAFYRWKCLPTWESAFYFSATTYSTVGYGDVVLRQTWRLMGPMEGITGVLMCGLSASFMFAIVLKLLVTESDQSKR